MIEDDVEWYKPLWTEFRLTRRIRVRQGRPLADGVIEAFDPATGETVGFDIIEDETLAERVMQRMVDEGVEVVEEDAAPQGEG